MPNEAPLNLRRSARSQFLREITFRIPPVFTVSLLPSFPLPCYSTFQSILILENKFPDFEYQSLIQLLGSPNPKDSDSLGLQVLMQMLILECKWSKRKRINPSCQLSPSPNSSFSWHESMISVTEMSAPLGERMGAMIPVSVDL